MRTRRESGRRVGPPTDRFDLRGKLLEHAVGEHGIGGAGECDQVAVLQRRCVGIGRPARAVVPQGAG